MQFTDEPEFTEQARREIYEVVERYGAMPYEEVRRTLEMDPGAFGHHVAVLTRDGVLERVDGDLRVAFERGTEEEYEVDGTRFVIRQARQEDLTGLVGAIRETAESAPYIEAESVADVLDQEGALLRRNDLQSRVFFVATVEGEVVGWAHVEHPELEKLAHTAELTVGVLDRYRGMGIGSHLLVRGVGWAAAHGYEKLYQSLPATNEAAVEWLEDNGWGVEAVREDHYRIDDEYVDEVMMALDV